MLTTITNSRTARFTLLWVLCPLVALATFRILFGGVAVMMTDFLYHAELRPVAFFSHIFLASAAIALVPFQFSQQIRRKHIAIHRNLGRVYAITIVIAGISGLWLAITTESGRVAAWGFSMLAIVWLGTTLYAVNLAMRGNIAAHRRWMIRSAAVTMAAITLRFYLVMTFVFGLSFEDLYFAIAWACWIPNLLIAEFIIRREGKGRLKQLRVANAGGV